MAREGELARRPLMLSRASRGVLDFVFPPLCPACRTRVAVPHSLCGRCWNAVTFLDGALCTRCGAPFEVDPGADAVCGPCYARPHDFDRARALLRYDDASKGLILAFKHGDRLDHAPAFARWLERVVRAFVPEVDVIVPVPLHRWRLWSRRYNQAAVLATQLGKIIGRASDPVILNRTRATPSQGAMTSARGRRRNVLGAFRVDPAKAPLVRGKEVLLVDDVYTTGATLDACARALKRAGAKGVAALTLARVVRPE